MLLVGFLRYHYLQLQLCLNSQTKKNRKREKKENYWQVGGGTISSIQRMQPGGVHAPHGDVCVLHIHTDLWMRIYCAIQIKTKES